MSAGLLLLVALLAGCTAASPAPRAVRGTIDLTAWDPALERPVRLDGEWAFHWRQLVDPNDTVALGAPRAFTGVPGSWSGTQGFATYHLRALLPSGTHRFALRLLTVSTAYRLYADGQLVAARGQVAENVASGKPDYDPVIVDLTAREGGSIDLVLQASNFHYAKGGAWEPIWLGDPAGVRELREDNVALNLFLVGSFVVIGLYHEAGETSPIVTVSIGVATVVPNRHDAPGLLVERADAGLYEAKKRGRNCVAAA